MNVAAANASRDEYIRHLIDECQTGVVKIYIRPHGSREVCGDGWSGFLIAPDTILTIAHAFKDLSKDERKASDVVWVEFFERRAGTLEAATLIALDFLSEFGLLRCRSPNSAHIFTFASHEILSSTSILSVSHPMQRDWVTLRGTVCRPPFRNGNGNGKVDSDMVLFDHDVQTFAGASGVPMINLSGEVVGIQCFEVSYTVHGYCIPYADQDAKCRYAYDFKAKDKNKLPPLEIVPLKFIPSNIKQAIAVEYIDKVFRRFFKNERASEDCDLNEFISGLFKQRIENPSSSSAPSTGKSSPLGLSGTMQHSYYQDSRLKLIIKRLAPSVVSVVYFTGIHRIVDCTGFIIDWDDSKGIATVLTSAKLMRSPLDRDDYRIVVRLANGKMLLAEEDYVDYYHNIVTFKVNSDVKLSPLDLFPPLDHWRPLDIYSNLEGIEVVALARDFNTCELSESCGLFSKDYPCFGCVQLASSTCRTTRAGEGGPLITEAGQIIGINFFDGHGYVHPLPISVIRLCLRNWNSHGIVMQPWLGFTVGISDSLVVKEVYKGSPADKVGVRSGDSISFVSVNRKKYELCGLQEYAELLNGISDMLSACRPNQTDTMVSVSVNDNSKLVCAENLSVNDKNFCSSWLGDESDWDLMGPLLGSEKGPAYDVSWVVTNPGSDTTRGRDSGGTTRHRGVLSELGCTI